MPSLKTSPTPNPNSLKFTLRSGSFIESGMESFSSPEEASGHALGKRIFEIAGVENVFILPEFLTVTKDPAADWDDIVPEVESAVSELLGSA